MRNNCEQCLESCLRNLGAVSCSAGLGEYEKECLARAAQLIEEVLTPSEPIPMDWKQHEVGC